MSQSYLPPGARVPSTEDVTALQQLLGEYLRAGLEEGIIVLCIVDFVRCRCKPNELPSHYALAISRAALLPMHHRYIPLIVSTVVGYSSTPAPAWFMASPTPAPFMASNPLSSPLLLPASKRHKTDDSIPSESSEEYVYLLTLIPECKRKVTAFLTLQEALSVRSAHRSLHYDGGDAFRYSALMKKPSIVNYYWFSQCNTAVNLISRNPRMLPTLLPNETVSEKFLYIIFRSFIRNHGQEPATPSSVALLVKDDRLRVDEADIDRLCKRDLVTGPLLLVLQQDERLKSFLKTCISCDEHFGCRPCANRFDGDCDGEIGKYCRSCASEGPFCQVCKDFICSDCMEQEKTYRCDGCGNATCCDTNCSFICNDCERRICERCSPRVDERDVLLCGPCTMDAEWSESEGDYTY